MIQEALEQEETRLQPTSSGKKQFYRPQSSGRGRGWRESTWQTPGPGVRKSDLADPALRVDLQDQNAPEQLGAGDV